MSLPNSIKIWVASVNPFLSQNWSSPVDLSAADFRWQIAAEWLEIAQWSQWTDYRKRPPPSLSNGTIADRQATTAPSPNGGLKCTPGPNSRRLMPLGKYDGRHRRDFFCITRAMSPFAKLLWPCFRVRCVGCESNLTSNMSSKCYLKSLQSVAVLQCYGKNYKVLLFVTRCTYKLTTLLRLIKSKSHLSCLDLLLR